MLKILDDHEAKRLYEKWNKNKTNVTSRIGSKV